MSTDSSLLDALSGTDAAGSEANAAFPMAAPINPAQPPAPPPSAAAAPAPKPGIWHSALTGMLEGLTNTEGQTHGAVGGVISGLTGQEPKLRAQFDAQQQAKQNQLQFESVKAADSHILALAQAKMSDLASQKLKLEIDAQSQAAKVLNDILRIDPPAEVTSDNADDMHSKAIGTLPTLAAANGGKIPAVATTNSPDEVGADPNTHTLHAYATTPASLQQNPDGNRALVNYFRMSQGLPTITDQEWKSGGGAAFTAENTAATQTLQNKIATFKSAPNYNPNDKGQQAALALLNRNLSFLQTGSSEAAQQSAQLAANAKGLEATATETAKKPFVEAEHRFQSGLQMQAKTLDRTNADQNTRALKADTMITTEANSRDTDLSNINALKTNLAQVDAGNQAALSAFQVKFAEHEIVEGGVKRLNTTELDALTKGLGDYGRQFQSWVDKGFKGNMPAAPKNDMGAILNAEAQSRNNLYNQRVGNINEHILGQKGAAPTANQDDMDLITKFGGKAH